MPRNLIAPSALVGVAIVLLLGPAGTPVGVQVAAAASVPECRLQLLPPRSGEPLFAVPAGGRATIRTLPGRILLCTLFRADGSRFAHAQVDRLRRLLELRFFRPSGPLLFAADAAYPAFGRAEGAQVRCASPANSSIGNHYWRETFRWRVGRTPSNLPRPQVVHALRAAQSQWTNNINWCNYGDRAESASQYEGYTTRRGAAHDGQNTIDWSSLRTQSCARLALACTTTWYDSEGNPLESDVRFNAALRWSIRPGAGDNDIQSVAAHEFGHVRQFGHVTDASRGENTVIMWPYVTTGDTSGRKLGRGDALANNNHY